MKETTGESTPRPDTSTSLPPDHSSFDEPEPEDRWGLETPVCVACGATEGVEIVKTEEYGQRALCAPCRRPLTIAAEDTSRTPTMDRPAREGRTRRSVASESGRGEGTPTTVRPAMDASDPNTPEGESADGKTYRFRCGCGEEWHYIGELDEEARCPSCGFEVKAVRFLWWWVRENTDWVADIEVSVPPVVALAAQLCEDIEGSDRDDLLLDLVRFSISWDFEEEEM